MGNSIFGIGTSALHAAQTGLLTAGHNIANAATPGYTRQQVNQSANLPQATRIGFLGQGVQVDTVKRVYNQFLANQVSQAQAQSSQLDTYYAQMRQIDGLLADPSAGLVPALQDFFKGVQDLAANPSVVASRQAMLSGGQALVSRFQALDGRLAELRDGVNSQIQASVSLINTLGAQIARLNESIVQAESGANGRPANDLLDQRDQLVAQLNQEVRASVVRQSDGSYNVFIGNGQSLVVGSQSFQLAATAAALDASRIEVAYVANGSTIPLKEESLAGGSLGGLLQFRAESLEPTRNALGRVAIGLAATFNDQHRLGQDLTGNLGGEFFTLPDPQVTGSAANTGSAVLTVSLSDFGALTASDYRLQFDGTNYTLTRLSDGVVRSFAGFPQTVDGVSLNLASGAAAAGDEFLIRPTANGARDIALAIRDTSLIAAAAPVRTDTPLANTGTGRISAGTVNGPPPLDPNLLQPVSITFTGANTFDVSGPGTGNPTGLSYAPGGSISYNGWTVQITGSPQPGDTFNIVPNVNGVTDNRNALALGALQTKNTLVGGTTSYQGAYGQLVSQVGNKTRELEVTSAAQQALVGQAIQAQQSISGVNLDEEAANLLRYQQAYQAAGKVMQVASTLFETLLSLGR